MNGDRLYFYGASGHGKVVVEIAEDRDLAIGRFIDASPSIVSLLDYTVSTDLPTDKNAKFFISIGNNHIRKRISIELTGYSFETIIHPKANLSKRVVIGEGTVVMAGVSINSQTVIGNHNIINTNASIDHDCSIGDFVHVSPNAALAGNVQVGEGTHVGIGASIIQGVKIGKWCTIGAGAVIIRDVPDGATVVGNPGQVIKIREID